MTVYPLCQYAFYEVQNNKMLVLKCKKSNELCIHSRYCSMLLKAVHTSTYKDCAIKDK